MWGSRVNWERMWAARAPALFDRLTPVSCPVQLLNPRTLRSHHLNKLVAIDGIVTKVGLVHPKLERLVQYCEATGSMEVRPHARPLPPAASVCC
jgi:DNA replicative helicase MCM subunit Mcm2 (Cdc46/Mcm family)